MSIKQILAAYDDDGVYVYQAFRPSIVEAALKDGTFGGGGFKMERMTWIKPSFGWMLYRAGYGMKENQQGILKIKITHAGFIQALSWAVLTTWNQDFYATEDDWKAGLRSSPVRVQWDPDRNLHGGRLERRAIQIGLRGKAVYAYVNDWIIGLEEVTTLANAIGKNPRGEFETPEERVYPADATLKRRLRMD